MNDNGTNSIGFRLVMNARPSSCLSEDEGFAILDACEDETSGLRFFRDADDTLRDVARPQMCLNIASAAAWLEVPEATPYWSVILSDCQRAVEPEDEDANSTLRNTSTDFVPGENERFIFGDDGTIRPVSMQRYCLNVAGGIGLPGFMGPLGRVGDGANVVAYRCTADSNEVWRPDGPGSHWKPHLEKAAHVPLALFKLDLLWHIFFYFILCCFCCCCLAVFARSRHCQRIFGARSTVRLLDNSQSNEMEDIGDQHFRSPFSTPPAGARKICSDGSDGYVPLDANRA